MNIKFLWKFIKPNETIFLMFGVFFAVTVITVIAMYRNQSLDNSKVRYENLTPEQRRQVESVADEIRLGEDDVNLRYAERIREASSLGLGLSLYLVRERVSRNRILTIAQTMSEFAKADVLPPGCEVLLPATAGDFGLVQTARGLYYIRYSAAPLKIEILAAGFNGLTAGSTFILRVPDTSAARLPPETAAAHISSAGAWATLFEAPANENHYIPPAFAPVQTFEAMNWQVRGLQQTEFAPEKIRELNNFLRNQSAEKK